jgi:transglutaminase-like putative cysteine protease
MVPESSRRGGSAILITGAGSHAWPEIYLDGIGWVIVDVAPELRAAIPHV